MPATVARLVCPPSECPSTPILSASTCREKSMLVFWSTIPFRTASIANRTSFERW
jgi:hypothetical protein